MPTDKEWQELRTDVQEIKTLLKGYDNKNGLCDKVANQGASIIRLWLILAVITGGSGGGIFALFRMFVVGG
ncbi:MAG: hypothetical protein Q8O55_03895 [Dehalococcoidales bacterium]|nr:hypothetical protein [Dehalococcoidales bacterium]